MIQSAEELAWDIWDFSSDSGEWYDNVYPPWED